MAKCWDSTVGASILPIPNVSTREDIANAVRQQVTRFRHGAANAETDGIQRLPHSWQRVVTAAGDYFEGL